jgi:hypothetical protein
LLDLFVNHFDLHLSEQSAAMSSPCTILVCAPSNKAISVVVEKYLEILPPNRWEDRPVVVVGVQEKLESCSSHQRRSHTVEEGGEIPGHDSRQTLAKIASETLEILSLTSLPINEATQPSGLLPPSLVHLITTIISPIAAMDCLIYSYPPRYASLFLGFSIVYCECLHQITSSDAVSRPLILAMLDCLTQEYYLLTHTLHQTTPSFASRYCTKLHQDIVRVLERISDQLDLLFEDTSALNTLSKETMETSSSSSSSDTVESSPEDIRQALQSHSTPELKIKFAELSEIFLNSSQEYLRDLLDHAAVICSTLSSAGNSLMRSCHNPYKSIDLLLIDEAGQCLESELLIPFYSNPLHLVLVGDPKQLPATVLSYQAQKLHLGESSLSRLMDHCGSPFDMLTIQYRMHPEICLFPNQHFYHNQLKTAAQVIERRALSQHLQLSLKTCEDWFGNYLWIDVSGSETTGGPYGKSKANPTEATIVAR